MLATVNCQLSNEPSLNMTSALGKFCKLVLDDFVTKGFLTLLKLIRDRPEGHKALFFLSIKNEDFGFYLIMI